MNFSGSEFLRYVVVVKVPGESKVSKGIINNNRARLDSQIDMEGKNHKTPIIIKPWPYGIERRLRVLRHVVSNPGNQKGFKGKIIERA